MSFSNTRENVGNNKKDLLNNNILNKRIKSNDNYNPKTKTYFYFAFHPRNSKSAKEYFLQIQIRIQICLPMIQTGFCVLV